MNVTHTGAAEVPDRKDRLGLAGRIISGLVAFFLLLDGTMKLVPIQPVIDSSHQLGWPADLPTIRALGLILVGSTLLYVYPRTALLGAILVTAYLGGAVATHMRIGSPLFSHTLFGVYLGLMVWAGLWLRFPELRRLIPLRD